MAEENQPTQAQQDDAAVRQYVRSLYDEWRQDEPPRPSPQPQQQPTSTQQQHQMVRDIIDPVYGQEISLAHLKADAAQDYSRFYMHNQGAIDHETEIERIFQDAVKQGRPTPRETIYDYLVGNMYRSNPDKFNEHQKRQLDRVRAAEDLGGGLGRGREDELNMDRLKSMSLEEMEASPLMGLVF